MTLKIQKLLVIGHVWPQPNATAAGEHMLHLIGFFQQMNYEVYFASAALPPENYSVLKLKNITTFQIKLNDDNFDKLLLQINPNVVLFDRFMTEEQFSWRVYKNCPIAIRVLDTEDLHFLRDERYQELKKNTSEAFSDIKKRELASILRCDISFVISEYEKELLISKYQINEKLLFYLPLLHKEIPCLNNLSFKERKDFVFVGNFLHKPNWSCVQFLKKEIWPILSKKLPTAKLHIYGSHASEKHFQLSNSIERFIVHGYTENLTEKLQKARVMLAPVLFGAGQKGKFLHAMQNGLPNITTKIGAESMDFNNQWSGFITRNLEEIILKSIELYSNESIWNDQSKKGIEILKEHFNYDTHYERFEKMMSNLKQTINSHRKNNIMGQLLWHQSLRSTEFMSRWIMEKNKQP